MVNFVGISQPAKAGIVSLKGGKVFIKRVAPCRQATKGTGVSDRAGIGFNPTVWIKVL